MKLKRKYWNFFILAIATGTFWLNVLMTSPTVAKTALTKEEIAQMVRRQAKAWEEQDVTAISDDFAEDAIFIAAGFKFEGKQRIKQAARDYFKQFHDTYVKIERIIIDGNEGAVQWDWRDRNRQSGREGFAEDAIIFGLENGKIVYWREYIEKKKPI